MKSLSHRGQRVDDAAQLGQSFHATSIRIAGFYARVGFFFAHRVTVVRPHWNSAAPGRQALSLFFLIQQSVDDANDVIIAIQVIRLIERPIVLLKATLVTMA